MANSSTDLDLHCLQSQDISGFSRTKVKEGGEGGGFAGFSRLVSMGNAGKKVKSNSQHLNPLFKIPGSGPGTHRGAGKATKVTSTERWRFEGYIVTSWSKKVNDF